MSELRNKLSMDLMLRVLVVTVAFHLALAWLQAFQTPWPLEDAFELADSFEGQLFQSLGISFSSLKEALLYITSLFVSKELLEMGSRIKRNTLENQSLCSLRLAFVANATSMCSRGALR